MNYRIGTGKGMLIYGTAGFFDLLQAVLLLFTGGIAGVIQTIFGLVGYGILMFMFATSSVSFFPAKKITGAVNKVSDASNKASQNSLWVFIALMIIELIPWLGSISPSLTINSHMTIKASQAEDDAKDSENESNPNVIRQKNNSSGGANLPKPPGTLREARNRVS